METEASKVEPPKRKRRWFQFSLRTLLLFTLICAVGSAWVAHRMEQKRREREAVDAIVTMGGSAWYGHQVDPLRKLIPGAKPPGPSWLRSLLGENFFSEVVRVSFPGRANGSDGGLVYLKELTQLQTLSVWGTQVTDPGLEHLKGLTQLQTLDLSLNAGRLDWRPARIPCSACSRYGIMRR